MSRLQRLIDTTGVPLRTTQIVEALDATTRMMYGLREEASKFHPVTSL